MAISSRALEISKVEGVDRISALDDIAVEEPLEIRLGYRGPQGRALRSLSITMRTPGNDAELAAGFLLTEGIIGRREEIAEIGHCGPLVPGRERNIMRVELADEVAFDIARLERHFYTTSSCGVCGKTSLDALRVIGQAAMRDDEFEVAGSVLRELPENLRARQAVFQQTGGLHAAALFDAAGRLRFIREDVGRHNAVDKLVGALLLSGALPVCNMGLLVSGRASFELMQKAMMARIPLLAAVGAPSSLAVELAREFNMSLIGFLHHGRFNIYAGAERVCRDS